MYEFKNIDSSRGLKRGKFDHSALQNVACGRYVEGPRMLTLVRHTDYDEASPIHCQSWVTLKESHFQVPKQKFMVRYSENGLCFVIVHVINDRGFDCLLVVCETNRQAFLLNPNVINLHAFAKLGVLKPHSSRKLRQRTLSLARLRKRVC